MIRTVLIDSHRLFRVSLKSLINSFDQCQVCLDLDSFKNIPKNNSSEQINLVILDPNSIQENEAECFFKIRTLFPGARVIILSEENQKEQIVEQMERGVYGIFSKDDCPIELEKAITTIADNYDFEKVHLGGIVRKCMANNLIQIRQHKVDFSDREIQILRLVCMEKTNVEISQILGVSVRTIESHRRRMIDKAECRSIIGVILNAVDVKSLDFTTGMPAKGYKTAN